MNKRRHTAFTMLELIMVIVVLGILAAVGIPRLDSDVRQQAGDNILSAIRYTQHLALMDDKTDPRNPTGQPWQRSLWHIRFAQYTEDGTTKWFYTISSSRDGDNNVDLNEVASDPRSGQPMYHLAGSSTIGANESRDIFLGKNYGITVIDFTACDTPVGAVGTSGTAVQHIAFDHLGRPHRGIYNTANNYATLMHGDCTIRFRFLDYPDVPDMLVTIEQQTGHAFIVGQPDS